MTEFRSLSERHPMRARELHSAERDDAWSYISDHFAGYALYQAAVDRMIPVLVLEPRD